MIKKGFYGKHGAYIGLNITSHSPFPPSSLIPKCDTKNITRK